MGRRKGVNKITTAFSLDLDVENFLNAIDKAGLKRSTIVSKCLRENLSKYIPTTYVFTKDHEKRELNQLEEFSNKIEQNAEEAFKKQYGGGLDDI